MFGRFQRLEHFSTGWIFPILQSLSKSHMSEINKVIRGRKLTKYRELRGLTKEDMATKLGVSPNTYGRYEKGEFEPKVEQWEQIAGIVNVPIEELLTTDPIVVYMTNSHGPNVSGTNNQNFPSELLHNSPISSRHGSPHWKVRINGSLT